MKQGWWQRLTEKIPMTEAHTAIKDESFDEMQMRRIAQMVGSGEESAVIESLMLQPTALRALWSSAVMQQTVENGGFKQYFWNYQDTRFYDELRRGLRELNAVEHLEVFERAFGLIRPHLSAMLQMQDLNDYFSKYKPLLKSDGTSDKLLKLDAEFYDLRPTLTRIRVMYLKQNQDKCGIH